MSPDLWCCEPAALAAAPLQLFNLIKLKPFGLTSGSLLSPVHGTRVQAADGVECGWARDKAGTVNGFWSSGGCECGCN